MINRWSVRSVRKTMHKIIAGACRAHRDLAAYRALLLAAALSWPQLSIADGSGWPAWDAFRQYFIQFDGRVVEHESDARTTSEAQAYAMFFALVNNQRPLFDLLLDWTEKNLARGDLKSNLPGWLWGRAAASAATAGPAVSSASRWRLLDDNSASDADLWIAYSLLEAARLWKEPRYHELGMALLEQVKEKEILRLSDGFVTLLPAPRGFHIDGQLWRVNPSYFVPQQFALFSRADPAGPWQLLGAQLPEMLETCCPSGYAPDWVSYRQPSGWLSSKDSKLTGSYDAIRVYLWAGMMDSEQPGRERLLAALHGMRSLLRARIEPPDRIDLSSGRSTGKTPPGFLAAVAPYLQAVGEKDLLERGLERLRAVESGALYGKGKRYYDQVLALYGLGYIEQRFQFNRCGELEPAWNRTAKNSDRC